MNLEEIKKDFKNAKVNKNMIIIVLAVAFIAVSMIAVGSGFDHKGYRGGRGSHNGRYMNRGDSHMAKDDKMMAMDKNMMPMGSMDSMMMDMTKGMQGKSGKELEQVFLKEMIVHHQGAVDMAKLLLKDPTISPDLAKFANAIIAAQEPEIVQMNAWLKNY